MIDLEAMRERWQEHIARYGRGTQPAQDCFRRLVDAHAEPHRHYHTLEHIADVLDFVDDLADAKTNLFAVRLAGWFHDVIYDSKAKDNEQRAPSMRRRRWRNWAFLRRRSTEWGP